MVSQGAVRRRVTRRGHAAAARARKVFPWRQVFPAITALLPRQEKQPRSRADPHGTSGAKRTNPIDGRAKDPQKINTQTSFLPRSLCSATWPAAQPEASAIVVSWTRRIAAGHRTAWHIRASQNRNLRVISRRALSDIKACQRCKACDPRWLPVCGR